MTGPDHSRAFEDPGEQIRRIQARIEELRVEARTATRERRAQIGWWIVGARRHMGRLMDVNLARRFGEHRFVIHEMENGKVWALCSCGARFPGRLHADFSLEQFPTLPGHVPQAAPGIGAATDVRGEP